MNELKIFENVEFGRLEVLEIDGKPYFLAAACAKILGYSNPHKAIRDHCKGVNEMFTPSAGGRQRKNFIPEGDLYRLIIRSKLPSAQRFERWVMDEVLPSIRKHGIYAVDEVLKNPDMLISALTALKAEREMRAALELETRQQKQVIGEMKPKADYTDRILRSKSLVTVRQIAQDYGMSAQAMNGLLHECGVQFKQSGQWLLYSKYHGKGYTHSETVNIQHKDGTQGVKMNTKWTQKGRLFIYTLLKKRSILPTIEQEPVEISA